MIRVSVCGVLLCLHKQRREPEFEHPKQPTRLLHKPLIPFLKKRMTP